MKIRQQRVDDAKCETRCDEEIRLVAARAHRAMGKRGCFERANDGSPGGNDAPAFFFRA